MQYSETQLHVADMLLEPMGNSCSKDLFSTWEWQDAYKHLHSNLQGCYRQSKLDISFAVDAYIPNPAPAASVAENLVIAREFEGGIMYALEVAKLIMRLYMFQHKEMRMKFMYYKKHSGNGKRLWGEAIP